MPVGEEYGCVDDRDCVACTTLRIRIAELELTNEALRRQAQQAATDEARRVRALTEIKLMAEVSLR
jgi:hypothetical protein